MVTDADAFAMVKRTGGCARACCPARAAEPMWLQRCEWRAGWDKDKRVVTMIPDSAERYLSKKIFEGGI